MDKRILLTKMAEMSDPLMVSLQGDPIAVLRDTVVHPEVASFVQNVRVHPSKTWVLVNAMGAGEWYGDNINGDYFPHEELVSHTPEWLASDPLDRDARHTLAAKIGYGYPTFYLGHVFEHHRNKDPARSLGDVELAVWNDEMKRVELVLCLDHHKCKSQGAESVLSRILEGDFPDVSMGTKVPYDVCSICGNKARHKGEYCEHIRERRINPDPAGDGRKAYMINVRPRFFDISFVFIGADKTARTLLKIAHAEDPLMRHIAEDARIRFHVQDRSLEKVAHALYESGYDPYEDSPAELEKAAGVAAAAMSPRVSLYLPGEEPAAVKAAGVLDGLGRAAVKMDRQEWRVRKGIDLPKKTGTSSPSRTTRPEDQPAASSLSMRSAKTASGMRGVLRKAAALQKQGKHLKAADIIKYVTPHPRSADVSLLEGEEPDLPDDLLRSLGRYTLSRILAATRHHGIKLKPREFAQAVLRTLPGDMTDEGRRMADEFFTCGLPPESPDLPPHPLTDLLDSSSGDSGLEEMLTPLLSSRSWKRPHIHRRAVRIRMIKMPGAPAQVSVSTDPPTEGESGDTFRLLRRLFGGYSDWLKTPTGDLPSFFDDFDECCAVPLVGKLMAHRRRDR